MNDRAIFVRLKTLPLWQEAIARYRFSLIREWDRLSAQQTRNKCTSPKLTKKQYCASKGANYKTFFKWSLDFKRKGIEGLIPRHGQHKKGNSKYDKEINRINSALLSPARTVKELHAEVSSICKAKKMEIPSSHTLRRILKSSDLRDFLVEGHGFKSWIKINRAQGIIEVNLSIPMDCIERMEKRLRSHPDAHVLIQLMRLRLENYVANRRREELHSLTLHGMKTRGR